MRLSGLILHEALNVASPAPSAVAADEEGGSRTTMAWACVDCEPWQ